MPQCNMQYREDLEKSREEQVFVCEPELRGDCGRVSVLLSTAQMVDDAITYGHGGVLVVDATFGTNKYKHAPMPRCFFACDCSILVCVPCQQLL